MSPDKPLLPVRVTNEFRLLVHRRVRPTALPPCSGSIKYIIISVIERRLGVEVNNPSLFMDLTASELQLNIHHQLLTDKSRPSALAPLQYNSFATEMVIQSRSDLSVPLTLLHSTWLPHSYPLLPPCSLLSLPRLALQLCLSQKIAQSLQLCRQCAPFPPICG